MSPRAAPPAPARSFEISNNDITSHLPKIVYCYWQLLALDALHDGHDLGIAGCGNANLRAFVNNVAIGEFDFGAAPLEHILTHGGTLQFAAPTPGRFLDQDVIDLLEGGCIAVARLGQRRGINFADLFELVSEGLADSYCLSADPDDEMADVLVLIDFSARKTGGRRHAIPHRVVTQLRPALTPKIGRHLGAVHHTQQFGDVLGALGRQAMDLADTEDRMRCRALGRLPTDLSRLEQLY